MKHKTIKTADINRSNAILILEEESEYLSIMISYRLKIVQNNTAITLNLSYGNEEKAKKDFDTITNILLTISGKS